MSEFLDISRGIVEDFLQTAVFLDDEAKYPEDGDAITQTTDPATGKTTRLAASVSNKTNDSTHDLDAKTIIDTFMEKGIVCSIVKCEEATFDTKKQNYIKLMRKADIVVLDWDLFGDGGSRVVDIVKDLTQTDEKLHELRLIVIYTANDLETVKRSLEEIRMVFDINEYVSRNNKYTTVSIFNKESNSTIVGRTVKFNELINSCIKEFTETFHGIVPNVAMAAISEIRKNTHKLLGVLNKELDPAYLSHRALLPIPEEAEKHIEELIVSEIESIIHGNRVGHTASYENISKSEIIRDKKYQNVDFKDYLKGVQNKLDDSKKKKLTKDAKACFTKEWYGEEHVSTKSEKKLAILSLMQTSYDDKDKYLTLGVIVEQENKEKTKLLCLQPRCDSARLESNTDFIFLELKKSSDKFDILFGEEEQKYQVVYGKEYRKTISFLASVNKLVEMDSSLLVEDVKSNKYKFIGQLKKTQAQRIANEYGAYITRVGLNESEYLRRNRV